MISQLLRNHKSTLVLDGTIPKQNLLKKICGSKKIICTDGSYSKVIKLGIKVNYVSGDFDSIGSGSIGHDVKINRDEDQYSTDFEKTIALIRSESLGPAIITGFSGGEIDHIMGNIQILVKFFDSKNKHEFCFIDQDNKGNVKIGIVVDDYFRTSHRAGSIVSLTPFPEAIVSSEGLKYPMHKMSLKQTSGLLAIRNETSDNNAFAITIHSGRVLLIADISYLFD